MVGVIDPLAFIDSVEWTFAKSMPWIPHFYIVRRNVDHALFDELALHVRIEGRLGLWGSHLHWYLHLPEHEWYYWTMGWPLAETVIINRAEVSTDKVRYLEGGELRPGDREIIDTWCDFTECPRCLTLDPIAQDWETDDLFGMHGTRLVSLRCCSCGRRFL